MSHPRSSEIEAFVIGAMTAKESAAFVEHVSSCDACAEKLEREARAELALLEVHAASKANAGAARAPIATRHRRIRFAGAGAGVLALAAAVFLFVRARDGSSGATPPMTVTMTTAGASTPIPPVICHDGRDQERCIDEAHRHGLFVQYPAWAGGPPFGGTRSGQGPSGSPFPVPAM